MAEPRPNRRVGGVGSGYGDVGAAAAAVDGSVAVPAVIESLAAAARPAAVAMVAMTGVAAGAAAALAVATAAVAGVACYSLKGMLCGVDMVDAWRCVNVC